MKFTSPEVRAGFIYLHSEISVDYVRPRLDVSFIQSIVRHVYRTCLTVVSQEPRAYGLWCTQCDHEGRDGALTIDHLLTGHATACAVSHVYRTVGHVQRPRDQLDDSID